MDSTKDEEDSRIDYDCLAVDRGSTKSTSRSQLGSSEGNTYEEPSIAVERAQQAVVETQPLTQEEEKKHQKSYESTICSTKCILLILFIVLILFILLIFALVLFFFLHYPRVVELSVRELTRQEEAIASRDVDINKINELVPEHTSVMLLGGWHDDITNSTTIYNSMEKSWKNCKLTLPSILRDHGAALLNDEIYIFGGFENGTSLEPLKSLYKLGVGNKWERMADMNEKRMFISQSSVVFNSEIWVIGGSNGTNILKSVEKFNPKTKKWTEMPELNESRTHAAVTAVDGKIYVSGGWDGRKTKNSMEVYDPEKGKWEIFTPSLPYGAHSHILIRNNSHLITISGDLSLKESTNQVWKMDVLDPKREWEEMPSLKQKRKNAGAAIIADELMVFGGYIGMRINSVEIFDGVEWKNGALLPEIRSYFAYIPLIYAQERLFLKRFCQNS